MCLKNHFETVLHQVENYDVSCMFSDDEQDKADRINNATSVNERSTCTMESGRKVSGNPPTPLRKRVCRLNRGPAMQEPLDKDTKVRLFKEADATSLRYDGASCGWSKITRHQHCHWRTSHKKRMYNAKQVRLTF